jgi:hypothetical protein
MGVDDGAAKASVDQAFDGEPASWGLIALSHLASTNRRTRETTSSPKRVDHENNGQGDATDGVPAKASGVSEAHVNEARQQHRQGQHQQAGVGERHTARATSPRRHSRQPSGQGDRDLAALEKVGRDECDEEKSDDHVNDQYEFEDE